MPANVVLESPSLNSFSSISTGRVMKTSTVSLGTENANFTPSNVRRTFRQSSGLTYRSAP
jgi:hypothetical protein